MKKVGQKSNLLFPCIDIRLVMEQKNINDGSEKVENIGQDECDINFKAKTAIIYFLF